MDTFELESIVTEMEADARAIRTLVLDLSDDLPAGDDADKLHAIIKLAEDQLGLTKALSERLSLE